MGTGFGMPDPKRVNFMAFGRHDFELALIPNSSFHARIGDMTIRTGVGYTHRAESFSAGQEAVLKVLEGLQGDKPDFLFLFTTVGHDIPEVIRGIHNIKGPIPLCGCTGSGVITNLGCDEATHSIGLIGIRSDRVCFEPFLFSNLSADPQKVGVQIATRINALDLPPDDQKLLFLFPDGLTINADGLSRGLEQALAAHIDCVGGTAGNDFEKAQTYQFCNFQIASNAVAGVVAHGRFDYQIGASHGSKPVGLFRTITRATGTVIYEIDGQPALDLLKDYIGEDRIRDYGHVLNLFELGECFEDKAYCQDIINRAIIGVDEEKGGIRLAVEIPQGTKIKITRRDKKLVLKRTRQTAQTVMDAMKSADDGFYFFFNCSGRGSYLFGSPDPDIDALKEVLGPHKQFAGFYTFGEFAPIKGKNYFHNYTGILVGIE